MARALSRPMNQPMRQAWALAYAMRARPTPALAARYFDALRHMLDPSPEQPPSKTTTSPAPHG